MRETGGKGLLPSRREWLSLKDRTVRIWQGNKTEQAVVATPTFKTTKFHGEINEFQWNGAYSLMEAN